VSVDRVLEAFKRVKRSGKGWTAQCSAHDDHRASLSINVTNDGRILLHCFAGCTTEAVIAAAGLEWADLFPEKAEGGGRIPRYSRQVNQVVQVGGAEGGDGIPQDSRQVDQVDQVGGKPADTPGRGLTVEQLAEAKRLPVELLTGLGCETVTYFGPPAVLIPYTDEAGEIAGTRYRLALTSEPKFRWKTGTKASTLLYGVSRLREAREAGYVVLEEGETDWWTLTLHGFPAVALPGASMWSDEQHAARFDGIETV
jgi:putative DNA primase/helicase